MLLHIFWRHHCFGKKKQNKLCLLFNKCIISLCEMWNDIVAFVSVEVLYLVLEALSMNKLQVATERRGMGGKAIKGPDSDKSPLPD